MEALIVPFLFLSFMFACLMLLAMFSSIWLKAVLNNAPVPMLALISMRVRGTKPRVLVDALIRARKGGVEVQIYELETAAIAGVDVNTAVDAAIRAHHADLELGWHDITKMLLAGKDVDREIETQMN